MPQPYVVVDFDGQRRRTSTKYRDLNPAWNELFGAGSMSYSYLEPIKLNDVKVDWKSMDLNYLIEFLKQAKTICPLDPLVYNELGVVAYNMKEYGDAVLWFKETLAHIPTLSQMWEPTVVNLAHAYRKLKE